MSEKTQEPEIIFDNDDAVGKTQPSEEEIARLLNQVEQEYAHWQPDRVINWRGALVWGTVAGLPIMGILGIILQNSKFFFLSWSAGVVFFLIGASIALIVSARK